AHAVVARAPARVAARPARAALERGRRQPGGGRVLEGAAAPRAVAPAFAPGAAARAPDAHARAHRARAGSAVGRVGHLGRAPVLARLALPPDVAVRAGDAVATDEAVTRLDDQIAQDQPAELGQRRRRAHDAHAVDVHVEVTHQRRARAHGQ